MITESYFFLHYIHLYLTDYRTMPRQDRLAKRQKAKHIKTPIDVYIAPASDDDQDSDIMHSRFNHVPVLSPFPEPPKTPQSIFDLPGPHSMVNPKLANPYRQLAAHSCHIELDELYDYFRRTYRLIRQSLFDVLPITCHDQIGDMLPDTFAMLCLVLAKIRISYVHNTFFGTEFEFPQEEILRIEMPNCVAGPINSIGCITTGPNLTITVPTYDDPHYGVMYAFRDSLVDDSLEKLQSFVSVAKHYRVIKTSTLSLSMGGTLWWKLVNHRHPKHIHVLRNIYPHFSNIPAEDIEMAALVNPTWTHDFEKPVLRRYWLKASKEVSVRNHLAFNII